MGTDIEGVIEVRGAGGGWEDRAWLCDFGIRRESYAREVLFGYGGGLGTVRELFPIRGLPADAADHVPDDAVNHTHTYVTWAEVAAADRDAPLCDGPVGPWVGEWRPGPDGEPAFHDVVWIPDEVERAADVVFGEELCPWEWPEGGEVPWNGAVYRPVALTARMFAPPDGTWAPVWDTMRALAAEHGDEQVRLVVWIG
ncbi:hypothetical protein ABZV60_04690 [Streptomyces sp. NPDC004787]|uniref:hypothetical protein n=1 Tax=Streptomyces sp. NPDC004787 TaxID=3154291 RepID=UPI0033A8122B